MFERSSKKFQSSVSSTKNKSNFNLGTDISRDPVYLSGSVKSSVSFAQAMLVLGKVVGIRKPEKKDHSEYQNWVAQEYVRILNEREPERFAKQQDLISKSVKLKQKRDSLNEKLSHLNKFVNLKKKEYFNWLYENDRNAWIVLDPIVSVQEDGTFFEAFSGDESIYARVFLPHSAISTDSKPQLGTTNIDFSLLLEREFERVRSYRPMDLKVGLKSVEFKTAAAEVDEEKIPLPESWVRGLVEVQSVLSLAPTIFEMSADALAEIIARLQSEKEKTGPRSLKFILKPGEKIRVEIEPWNEFFNDDWFDYQESTSTTVRVWGRRRLSVLQEILIGATKVKVRLLGNGMPSFWTVVKDGVELTVGLSGWTSNDWASKAKFSSFIPTSSLDESKLPIALSFITAKGQLTTADMAQELNASIPESSAILQKLCLQGKVMFDPERNLYRWRDLFPTLDIYQENDSSRESRAGLKIFQEGNLKIRMDEKKDEIKYLSGLLESEKTDFKPLLELDSDNRPKYAQCNCSFYNFNKLKQGPCRHMIALLLVGDK
jgi:hypothetical protein